ncbi:hypothetical protein BD410DRAFT_807633 [Rickenella mellea]|uniref:Uncharacterized protein n=1 Tax=Rickenella mellea TaxID=50990 RepID=A0A4Y7PNL6_9AGAM|nr:hypothetical protein BD410DRAFT_807633 [Rickenella mellea]
MATEPHVYSGRGEMRFPGEAKLTDPARLGLTLLQHINNLVFWGNGSHENFPPWRVTDKLCRRTHEHEFAEVLHAVLLQLSKSLNLVLPFALIFFKPNKILLRFFDLARSGKGSCNSCLDLHTPFLEHWQDLIISHRDALRRAFKFRFDVREAVTNGRMEQHPTHAGKRSHDRYITKRKSQTEGMKAEADRKWSEVDVKMLPRTNARMRFHRTKSAAHKNMVSTRGKNRTAMITSTGFALVTGAARLRGQVDSEASAKYEVWQKGELVVPLETVGKSFNDWEENCLDDTQKLSRTIIGLVV